MFCLAKADILIGSITSLVPIVFLVYGIYKLMKLMRCTECVEAKIESVEAKQRYRSHDRRGVRLRIRPGEVGLYRRGRYYYIYVAKCMYFYNNNLYECEGIVLERQYEEGDKINLHINPNNPTEAIRKYPLLNASIIFCIVMSISCIIGMAYFNSVRDTMNRIKENSRKIEEDARNINPSELHESLTNNDVSTSDIYKKVDGSDYKKVNYHGVIKVVPKGLTEPIYPKNNKNSPWFVLKSEKTGEIVCKVTIKSYKGDVDKGMKNIAQNLESKYCQEYANVYRGREEKKNILLCIDKAYTGNGFSYFGYWIHNGQYVLIHYYGPFIQLKTIGTQSMLLAD